MIYDKTLIIDAFIGKSISYFVWNSMRGTIIHYDYIDWLKLWSMLIMLSQYYSCTKRDGLYIKKKKLDEFILWNFNIELFANINLNITINI